MRFGSFLTLLLALGASAQSTPGVQRFEFPPSEIEAFTFTPGGTGWGVGFTSGELFRAEPDGTIAFVQQLPFWGGTFEVADAADGTLWIGARHYIAHFDTATSNLTRWTDFRNVKRVGVLPDGTVWFVSENSTGDIRIVHIDSDGDVLALYPMSFLDTGASVGPDGAFWVVGRPNDTDARTALRVTDTGIEAYPVERFGTLHFMGGAIWLLSFDGALLRLDAGLRTIATYSVVDGPGFLSAQGRVDAAGNLWIRTAYAVGTTAVMSRLLRLTPDGLLTRYTPLPSLPRSACNAPASGAIDVAPDGRIGLTDFYPGAASIPEDHTCDSDPLSGNRSFLTYVNPSLLAVESTTHLGESIPALGTWQLLALAAILASVGAVKILRS